MWCEPSAKEKAMEVGLCQLTPYVFRGRSSSQLARMEMNERQNVPQHVASLELPAHEPNLFNLHFAFPLHSDPPTTSDSESWTCALSLPLPPETIGTRSRRTSPTLAYANGPPGSQLSNVTGRSSDAASTRASETSTSEGEDNRTSTSLTSPRGVEYARMAWTVTKR